MPKPNKLRIKHRLPPGLGTRTHKDQRKEASRTACRKTKLRASSLRLRKK